MADLPTGGGHDWWDLAVLAFSTALALGAEYLRRLMPPPRRRRRGDPEEEDDE